MSIWDTIGDTMESIGGAALAPAGVVWDLVSAPFDEKDHDFGSLVDEIAGRGKDALDPILNEETIGGMAFSKVMQGLEYVYREGVSEPITTGLTVWGHVLDDPTDNFTDMFSGRTWGEAYDIAQNRSIGQARFLTQQQFYDAFLPGERVGDPLDERSYKQLAKNHEFLASMGSGLIDFTARWYLDPGVVVGKFAKVAREAKVTRKITPEDFSGNGLWAKSFEERHGVSQFNPFESADIGTRTGKYLDFINRGASGRPLNEAQIYVATPELKRSANGRQIAGLLADAGRLDDPATAANAQRRILSVAWGDVDALKAARDELAEFGAVGDALKNLGKGNVVDLKAHALGEQIVANPVLMASMQGQLDNLDDVAKHVDQHVRKLETLLDTSDTLKYAPGVHNAGKRALAREQGEGLLRDGRMTVAPDAVTKPVNWVAERAQRLGEHVALSSVYQRSSSHMPVKVITHTAKGIAKFGTWDYGRGPMRAADALRTSHLQGYVSTHDWNGATNQLDSMMKLGRVDAGERLNVLSKVQMARTEQEKMVAINHVEKATMRSLVRKHGVNRDFKNTTEVEDFISAVMEKGQAGRTGHLTSMYGRAYGATKLQQMASRTGDEFSERAVRVDQIDPQDGVPVALPLLETQGRNYVPLFDAALADKALKREYGRTAKLAESWAQAGREIGRLKELQGRTGKNVQAGLEKWHAAQDWTVEAMSSAMRAWKFSVLFRLGYPLRVVADDHMRIWSQIGAMSIMSPLARETLGNVAYNRVGRGRAVTREVNEAKVRLSAIDDALAGDDVAAYAQRAKDITSYNRKIAAMERAARRAEERGTAGARREFEATGEELLHGTVSKFDKFGKGKNRDGHATTGDRSYFTDYPEVANRYGPERSYGYLKMSDLPDDFRHASASEFGELNDEFRGWLRDKNITSVQRMDEDGNWVDVDIDDITLDDVDEQIVRRKVREGRAIKSKVYGKTLDLRDPDNYPQEVIDWATSEAGQASQRVGASIRGAVNHRAAGRKPRKLRWEDHEYDQEFINWARAQGYGKIRVPDSGMESGGDSVIALHEFIEHNQDVVGEYAKRKGAERAAELRERIAALSHERDIVQEALGDDPAELMAEKAQLEAFIDLRRSEQKKLQPKRRRGQKNVRTVDGTEYEGAFAGDMGDAYRVAASSNATFDNLAKVGEERMFKDAAGGSGSFRVIHSDDPAHHVAWADVLNNQFRQSAVAMHFVKGGNVDDFVKWIKAPEQRGLRERLPHFAHDPEDWGWRVKQLVDDYLPTDELREMVRKGRVTPRRLDKMFPDVTNRPSVHGATIANNVGDTSRFQNSVGRTMNRLYRLIGEMPTDALSRHPYFAAMYEMEVKRIHARRMAHAKARGNEFTQADMDDIVATARKNALGDLQRTLFDISAQSNAAHVMRFVSPFFSAHQESLSRWWRIVADDPSVVRRFQQAFDAPRKLGIVVDYETGEPVKEGEMPGPGHSIMLRVPEAWGGGGNTGWVVNENSFNLILQSGLTNPGSGPLVQVPVETLVANNAQYENLEKVARLINPYPPDSMGDILLPATVKRVHTLIQGEKSNEYARMYATNIQDRVVEFKLANGDREPTQAEMAKIERDARDETNTEAWLRLGQNALSPAPASPRSKFEVFRQGWRKIADQATAQGRDYDWMIEQFKAKYGEAYLPMIASAANNPGGIDATNEAMGALKKYRKVIDGVDMRFAGAIIGSAGKYQDAEDYSSTVATELRKMKHRGSGEEFYSYDNPITAVRDAAVKRGWDKYSRAVDMLNTLAAAQGLQHYTQSDRLMDFKRTIVGNLSEENLYWGEDYNDFNPGEFDAQLDDLRMITSDRSMRDREDVKVVGKYLRLRDMFTTFLQARDAQGGSADPGAKSNQDLMEQYRGMVAVLAESNLDFEEHWFNGILDRDPYLDQVYFKGDVA